eukprot:756307-Hanusia_phi.AAC.3
MKDGWRGKGVWNANVNDKQDECENLEEDDFEIVLAPSADEEADSLPLSRFEQYVVGKASRDWIKGSRNIDVNKFFEMKLESEEEETEAFLRWRSLIALNVLEHEPAIVRKKLSGCPDAFRRDTWLSITGSREKYVKHESRVVAEWSSLQDRANEGSSMRQIMRPPLFGGNLDFSQHCLTESGKASCHFVLAAIDMSRPDLHHFSPQIPNFVSLALMFMSSEEVCKQFKETSSTSLTELIAQACTDLLDAEGNMRSLIRVCVSFLRLGRSAILSSETPEAAEQELKEMLRDFRDAGLLMKTVHEIVQTAPVKVFDVQHQEITEKLQIRMSSMNALLTICQRFPASLPFHAFSMKISCKPCGIGCPRGSGSETVTSCSAHQVSHWSIVFGSDCLQTGDGRSLSTLYRKVEGEWGGRDQKGLAPAPQCLVLISTLSGELFGSYLTQWPRVTSGGVLGTGESFVFRCTTRLDIEITAHAPPALPPCARNIDGIQSRTQTS